MLPFVLLGLASLVASGVLFRHRRVLTYLAAAGILFEAQWLLLTLFDRTILRAADTYVVMTVGAALLLIAWGLLRRSWTSPYAAAGSGRRDLSILIVLLSVLAAAWIVSSFNGFNNHEWVTHGFYNGDTATFVALVQKSLLTDGLVRENPFAANSSLEYPTLLHAGVASLLHIAGSGLDWLRFLPSMVYVQIAVTIPLFFLLWDIFKPEPEEAWRLWFGIRSRVAVLLLQAFSVLYVLAVSWDGYIYPQSHFFLTGLYVLLAALLLRGYSERGRKEGWSVVAGSIVALLLLLSNAVTGTAALIVTVVFYFLRAGDTRREVWQRLLYLAGVMVWGVLFLLLTPGEPSFSILPDFSYTAAGEMLRGAPIVLALLVAALLCFSRQPLVAAWIAALVAAGYMTFVFSSREIVIDNASRFFYHALLIGFPLLLGSCLQLFFWLRRELIYTSRNFAELATGWIAAVGIVGFLLLPVGASMASAHDNLMFQDEHIVGTPLRQALWWIEDAADPHSIFLASPDSPFAIPVFTGRALLRVDYWLSPDDILLSDIQAAFEGNKSAQENVVAHVDYLLLTEKEREVWEPLPFERVFDISGVVIYKLR